MAEYDNTNRGSIWRNEDKTEDKHPDFKGSLNVDGVDFWVSAWKRKEGANPKAPALSFSIKRKESATSQSPTKPNEHKNDGTVFDMDDDIPFDNPYKGRKCYVV